jgi:hypothetical protein
MRENIGLVSRKMKKKFRWFSFSRLFLNNQHDLSDNFVFRLSRAVAVVHEELER